MKAAVFFDRDDTLTKGPNPGEYITSPDQLELLPGVAQAIKRLNQAGLPVFVVTNQGQVALGLNTTDEIEMINQMFKEMLMAEGALITDIAYCPHRTEGLVPEYTKVCQCRKPKPGMLFELASKHGVDLSASFMVGDHADDIDAGQAAGCQTVLIESGKRNVNGGVKPDVTAKDIAGAVEWVFSKLHVPLPTK